MTVPTGQLLVPTKSNINSTRAWGRSERRSRRYRSYTASRYVPQLTFTQLQGISWQNDQFYNLPGIDSENIYHSLPRFNN